MDAFQANGESRDEETPTVPEEVPMDYSSAWKRVEELAADQRLEAAVSTVRGILAAAREDEAVEEWTRALVEGANLQIALHGYEDAVQVLREQPWPASPVHRSLLNLFYAHALSTYVRAYSWEIEGREKVASEGVLDLRTWTKDQILSEADRALLAVWSQRESWGSEPLGVWAAHLEENNYPPRIRGTVRDVVTYLWVEVLSNTSFWTASELNEVFRLPFEELLEGVPGTLLEGLATPDRHPLLKLAGLLADLEAWHAAEARPEAAFEARLERLRRLQGVYSEPQYAEERRAVRDNLRRHLEGLGRRFPWWSMGQAQLADFVRTEDEPDALIEARETALEGAGVHRGSLGARRCERIVAEIEAPDYSLLTMQSDGLGRRSIQVRHRNLEALHFRAYRLDLLDSLLAGLDANLLPSHPEIEALVGTGEPVSQWTMELPATPDFRPHATFVTPPMEDLGLYVIVASARADFADSGNRRVALNLLLTEMVLASRQRGEHLEVVVRSGEDGERLAGVEVDLYRFDYRWGHRRVGSQTTDAEGSATYRLTGPRSSRYFLVARRAEDVTLEPRGLWYGGRATAAEVSTAALIYTDRSIYRPLQDVLWKVVGYQAEAAEGRFQTLPGRDLTVELVDPNGEVVEAIDVETNSFGSASGSFQVPAGRLLGTWSLRTSVGGWSRVVVEEYKRPTFEVTLVDPEDPLRLNRPASMGGEVRYYFGLPVVTGQVTWSVSRVPAFPRWMPWYDRFPVQPAETIASGTSELDEDGRFQITFTPTVDERLAGTPGVSFRYELTARVTDEGGETRSAERRFRLGFVAIEASIDSERAFFTAGEPVELVVSRTDLNGVGRAGEGRWRLTRVAQPATTRPPAELPRRLTPGEEDWFHTPDDRLRARWETEFSSEVELASWRDGEEVRRGEVAHGEDGSAALRLDDLPPGIYRLHYSSEDEFGAVFELRHDLLVVGEGPGRLELPMLLLAERGSTAVGETLKVLVHSGLEEQELLLEIQSDGETVERRWLRSAPEPLVVEIPVEARQRGGFSLVLTGLVDFQLLSASQSIWVPWEDRELKLSFSSFRDRLRPGERETWRVTVSSSQGDRLERGAAEVLAYMYDRSLDLFAPHDPPSVPSLYPVRTGTIGFESSLGSSGAAWQATGNWLRLPEVGALYGDRLRLFDGYGIGGPGRRLGGVLAEMAPAAAPEEVVADQAVAKESEAVEVSTLGGAVSGADEGGGLVQLRSEFSETAFWHPHLVVEDEGAVSFEFTVPDSVTEWTVWLHALDRGLRGGSHQRQVRTVKELMVRPYLPRFLREGDRVDLVVVVNNSGDSTLAGELDFEILEPNEGSSLNAEFGISTSGSRGVPFSVKPGGGSRLGFPVTVPPEVGNVVFRVTARAGDYSDGELRPLPVLPGRMHLTQSRFVTLRDADRREMSFSGLVGEDDPTRLDEQLVVTLDAQLFYSVLQALPYLVRYPYECTEQTLNRFLSTGIAASLYARYPAVARMAKKLSERDTRFETWDQVDPNRKLALEETPWLIEARGGEEEDLVNVLKPRVAAAERRAALAKLAKSQTALGGFPWWPGGPPSPYMTLYLLQGFSRALEFGIEVPKGMIQQGWSYLHRHYLTEIVPRMMDDDCCWEFVTFLSHVLSSYPDDSWTEGLFSEEDRRQMLELSLRHWREHSPLLKSSLALALARQGRDADAERVWESVMDSARTSADEGTYWAPEERSWLWYNDTIEGHALALRTMTELDPDDPRRQGLVQWLLLNKQLNHWKSTRSTAEVIYALVHYLEREGTLAVREEVSVELGDRTETLVFEPDEYTGHKNQIVIRGGEIHPDSMSTIAVEKETAGILFASATWHFSTEKLPVEAEGDLFSVERRYFKRFHDGEEWILQPLAEGAGIEPGDQIEVMLSLRNRHAAEYVHLRDPRAAGFEPESTRSTYRWNLGIGWYEEVRDSGTNFFFDWLPAGEYTFRYRLRANMGGTFRVAPATVQSMYAPEFTAYSSGALLEVEETRP